MPDEFLTVAEIADLLKINQQTIRNWIDRGELAAVRVGARRVRVRRSDLDEFLAGSATRATNEDPEPDEDDARADLSKALDRARVALDDGDAELAAALRSLSDVADRLARALDDAAV